MSRAARMATGAGWLYGYRWTERLIDFASIVVLARLLLPDDFGLVAIAASVATIIEGLSEFDVGRALIRSRDSTRALFDTAWSLSTIRGVLATAIMVGIAIWLPDPEIAAVLMALAPSPLLKGLANPRFVAFERDLDFSRLAGLAVGSKLVTFAVTLTLALLYRSHWALVAGMLAGALTSLVLSYALRPYRPRWTFARSREIFAFSGWMSLTTMVTTLSMETDKLIVGRTLGVTDAGLYFMTQRVGVLPTRELISPLQRLLFPSLSEIAGESAGDSAEDLGRMRRAVAESINVHASLSLPAGCGFALVAGDLVPLLLGSKWLPIVPLLIVLVPFLAVRGTLSMALPTAMALGRTRLLFVVSTVYALVHVPLFVVGTIRYGLIGAVGSIVVAGVLYIYLNAWLLHHTVGTTAIEIVHGVRRPLVATMVMVGGMWALGSYLPSESAGLVGWSLIAVQVAAGAAIYGLALYAAWRLAGRPPGFERRLLALSPLRRKS